MMDLERGRRKLFISYVLATLHIIPDSFCLYNYPVVLVDSWFR